MKLCAYDNCPAQEALCLAAVGTISAIWDNLFVVTSLPSVVRNNFFSVEKKGVSNFRWQSR
jgi:hypothetical protein